MISEPFSTASTWHTGVTEAYCRGEAILGNILATTAVVGLRDGNRGEEVSGARIVYEVNDGAGGEESGRLRIDDCGSGDLLGLSWDLRCLPDQSGGFLGIRS